MSKQGLSVTVTGINKKFGSHVALDNVNIFIKPGEFISLLGPSGSGKTTLLMILAGFARPDSGSVKFGETEMIRMPPHKRNIGMMFQNYALFPHMTVGENVAYPLKLRRTPKAEIVQRVTAALDLVKLAQYGDRRVDQLSGGQRQRVALARAVVFQPQVLLMDEPLSALDKNLREQMQIEIRQLHEKLGMTTITVTHDQREALTMSDRVAVIDHGKLMQFGTPVELYERPANRFVAGFIGESTFIEHEGRTLVVRPERLQVEKPGQLNGGDWIKFAGRVQSVIFQGDSLLSTVLLSDKAGGQGVALQLRQTVSRTAAGNGSLNIDTEVEIGLHRGDAIFLDESKQ
ncbi:ABC transporter ATP-binding protein [Ferrovibrio sp.]|uniref:ABC transporter ATP-binding protein n=1 Tax=Ferrovibrio sp. TaxID=1917215 RepID=UPI0025B92E87|nr:ABC transporter ATP-binding protein [Ferrovibrio sp.]